MAGVLFATGTLLHSGGTYVGVMLSDMDGIVENVARMSGMACAGFGWIGVAGGVGGFI